MLSTEVFHRLRSAQSRSAAEQQLLSGRDWILVAAIVQLFASLYPLYGWINYILLDIASRHAGLHPALMFGITLLLSVLLLALWSWARYAPFRAAVAAVIVYLAIQGGLGLVEPHFLVSGAIVKSAVLLGLLQSVRTGYLRRRPL